MSTMASSSECGGIFKVRSATITSPMYPKNYIDELYCEWFLEVENNHRLSLRFDDFSTENSCEHDSVKVRIYTTIDDLSTIRLFISQIYNGFEKTAENLMDTLCGNEIPKKIYNSTDNRMLVVMQTDSSIEAKGFSARFNTVIILLIFAWQ